MGQETAAARGPLAADRAYVELRDRIVTLTLSPGSVLREEDLIRELGLGRTPVREAVKRLSLESLVEVHPRRGTYVTAIDTSEIPLIAEVRAELEGQAAELAARRMTGDQRSEARRLLQELEATDRLEQRAHMRLDERVHRFVWEAAHNAYLADALERFWALSLRIWYLVLDRVPQLPAAVHEQRDVVAALLEGDGARARALMREHVEGFQEDVLDALRD